jgi:putative transposase
MKTIEFKFTPNRQQEATLNEWLSALKWVWNQSLRLAEDFERFQAWDKVSKSYVPCCPIGWEYRYEKLENGEWAHYSCSTIAVGRKGEYKPVCPIKQDWREQLIQNVSHFGLKYYFTQKNHPNKPWFCEVPAKFVNGIVKSFADAWSAYKKGKRKKPKFKGERERITTLIDIQSKKTKIVCKYIHITKLGAIKVKTLDERWNHQTPIVALRICKRPSGWYLQLTGDVPTEIEPPSDRACGIDVGLQYIIADDAGKVVDPPKYYRKAEKRLRKLQRKVSRQRLMNGGETGGTKRSRQKIAKLHEKTRLQRCNFNHKISTYTVRTFGSIAVEDIKIANLTRKPSPKMSEDGKGYKKNGAKAKAGLNKSFADAGLGQLLTMMETKAKVRGREFVRVQPHYTSQDCPQCGHRAKKSLSTRTHHCNECGYQEQRDVAAAINIRAKANF